MALQLTISKTVYGQDVVIKNAYHRVENIEGNKQGLTFVIATYTQDLLHQVASAIYRFVPSDVEDAPRWDKQCYEYAKDLPDFVGAIDV